MDITSLWEGPAPSPDAIAAVSEFVRATNAGELATLAALFSEDAQVNDQLRDFWGHAEISAWLAREIVGEQVKLDVLRAKRHYDAVILHARISGNFETPGLAQPMPVDMHFTVQGSRIIRLLILLARRDVSEPEIRRIG
jgi:hypothetical protein